MLALIKPLKWSITRLCSPTGSLQEIWKSPFLTNCNILGIFSTWFWSLSLIFHSEFSNFYSPQISECQKQRFWDFLESGTWKFQENENLKILSEKSNSVIKTKWKKYPIYCNLSKMVISWFSGIWNLEIPGKWWFKNSEWKTKLSDQYWVGKIPNLLQFLKNGNLQRISIFSGIWNLEIWKFWKSPKMPKINL